MRKITYLTAIALGLAFFCAYSYGEEDAASCDSPDAVTNVEFAEMLTKALNIQPPVGTEVLSDEEYYEVLSNMLASLSSSYFAQANPGDSIDAQDLTDIIYFICTKADGLTFDEKLQTICSLSGIEVPEITPEDCVSKELAAQLINAIKSVAIAEAYILPDRPRINPFGGPGITEEPASQS
ncbi:hypothetical protein M0R36_01340 [bacterium]|jgi:hypothetical protein|nr:hypothetical protein [bacterium]